MTTRSTRLFLLPILLAGVLAFAARAAAAGDAFEFGLGLEPDGPPSDYSGIDLDAGLFASFGWRFDEPWTLELRVMDQDGSRVDLTSWQAGLRYHLPAAVDWVPFVQGGVHYGDVAARNEVVCLARGIRGPCPPLSASYEDLGVWAGGGVDWRFDPRFALRLDGRLVAYDSDLTGDLETDVDLTAGVVFRF